MTNIWFEPPYTTKVSLSMPTPLNDEEINAILTEDDAPELTPDEIVKRATGK